MTRNEFMRNLDEAITDKDGYAEDDELNLFLDLNWSEFKNNLRKWTYSDFAYFAREVSAYGFWEAVEEFDFNLPPEYENED